MPSYETAAQHFVRGQQLMTMADAGVENNPTNVTAMARAQALASVAQGHFHAAMAATAMSTQRDLLDMASGQVQVAAHEASPAAPLDPCTYGDPQGCICTRREGCEAIEQDNRVDAQPLVLERIRTDDGAYRVFEPKGVGTGSVTYDPANGDHGYLEVSAPLSQDFNEEAEERLLHDVLELRGDDGVFERLEYVYQRQAERASRPSLTCGAVNPITKSVCELGPHPDRTEHYGPDPVNGRSTWTTVARPDSAPNPPAVAE